MKISVLPFSFAGTAAAFWLLLFVSDVRASPTQQRAAIGEIIRLHDPTWDPSGHNPSDVAAGAATQGRARRPPLL